MDKILQGDTEEEQAKSKDDKMDDSSAEPKIIDVGLEPPVPEFILDMPNISAIDLDIMKLTALFTARRGRNFLAALSSREGRNYQFDFLRPNHSLFGYFNRLVDQYSKVINPGKETLEVLKGRTDEGARLRTLEVARKHAKWERRKREKEKRRQDDQEAERIAFAEIDWHDYAIVQTIEFTMADATSELPPPMSVQEVETMTLAQKRMAAMIMENTAEDVEIHRAKQAAAEAEAAAAVGTAGIAGDDAAMEESDDEDDDERKRREQEEEKEIERARAIQASSFNAAAGPMKIRTDYVPKLGSKNAKAAMTTCSICGQQIAVDELAEHMRIELLDPRWKEQRDNLEARKAQASELQRGANVGSSLRNLARTRVDIFGAEVDEERRKREEEEEREKRKEREKVVWDGHTASKANTLDKFSTNVNFDEQIAAIHRSKGLGPQQANAIGPGIGPAAIPAYLTATVSSGPQPASAYQTPPVMLPPLHFQGVDPTPGVAALAAANGVLQSQAGVVRTADQMEGAKGELRSPVVKSYSEEDWIGLHPCELFHPISLQFQLPTDTTKAEWKLDGKIVTIPDLPLNLLVSTLRERIIQHIGSTVTVSRIRLSYAGKMLTNKSTLASYNMEDEELVVVSLGDAKKK
ncbi:hypothetical protein BT96DRAFT_915412 [Gymnopus androsaceus JB14]|uniref:Uncharacterized protein n=1 Tax=Gymnopus androsaceus JB14 TaxID=1447944 RepID=A0A6A4IBJ2_9AGAR|nr:hypothetical protein BT96DRAFT_915412 [Gymnopus androsaceus JB14]